MVGAHGRVVVWKKVSEVKWGEEGADGDYPSLSAAAAVAGCRGRQIVSGRELRCIQLLYGFAAEYSHSRREWVAFGFYTRVCC